MRGALSVPGRLCGCERGMAGPTGGAPGASCRARSTGARGCWSRCIKNCDFCMSSVFKTAGGPGLVVAAGCRVGAQFKSRWRWLRPPRGDTARAPSIHPSAAAELNSWTQGAWLGGGRSPSLPAGLAPPASRPALEMGKCAASSSRPRRRVSRLCRDFSRRRRWRAGEARARERATARDRPRAGAIPAQRRVAHALGSFFLPSISPHPSGPIRETFSAQASPRLVFS